MNNGILNAITFITLIFILCWMHYIQTDIDRLNAVTFDSARCLK